MFCIVDAKWLGNRVLSAICLFGVLAGLDNLQVCCTIGLLPIRNSRKHLLALSFTFCEITAPVIGLIVGNLSLHLIHGAASRIGPLVMLMCGLAVLLSALRRSELANFENGPKILCGLPLALSVDNFVAGAGISALPYPVATSAFTIGIVSAVMSCAGLYFGAWIRRFVPDRLEFAVGAYLCLLAGRAM